jgi:hypothetical protein
MEQDHRNGNSNNIFYFSAFLPFPHRVPLLSLKKSQKTLVSALTMDHVKDPKQGLIYSISAPSRNIFNSN